MLFWWVMLVCSLIIPLNMIVFGLIMWKRPPKSINKIFGYRTERSMKNTQTWNFAHNFCGKLWLFGGIITLIISIIVLSLFYYNSISVIGITAGAICSFQIVLLIVSVIPTELALKRKFTDEGVKK